MTQATTAPIVKPLDLSTFVLAHGNHGSPDDGMCLLEAAAYMAGEPHSDHPQCVDVALAAFGRTLNDRLREDERQLLKPLLPRLIGTRATPALARRRALLLVDRHVRSIVPAFLRELPHQPQPELAGRMEGLPPVVDTESARRARDLACEVRDAARSHLKAAKKALPKNISAAAAAAADAAAAAAADAYAAADADADAAAAAYAAAAAAAAAAADADAAAAAAAAAYAAAAADAAAAAYAAADAAAAAAAYADAAAAAWKALRRRTAERSIAAFAEAIELLEAA